VRPAATAAEYKQVTVLFADVVHSMDVAAAVGAERLREIMAELLDRSTAVVKRYGGTLSQFTGDGIMAVFGAPIALEDHAVRACLAALWRGETGDVAIAVDEFEKLLADYIRVMGPNHRDTLATRRDLSLWHSVAAHREELPQAGRFDLGHWRRRTSL
jgi:hypothetical protein